MKREISFRIKVVLNNEGKSFYNNQSEFIESKTHNVISLYLIHNQCVVYDENKESVVTIFEHYCEIYVLMQFIGFLDKNGVKIFEGDIYKDEQNDLFKVIRMDCGRYALELIEDGYVDEFIDWSYVEIIGNIHDSND